MSLKQIFRTTKTVSFYRTFDFLLFVGILVIVGNRTLRGAGRSLSDYGIYILVLKTHRMCSWRILQPCRGPTGALYIGPIYVLEEPQQ
jgi:hypothetical protein